MTDLELAERIVRTVQQQNDQLDSLYARTMAAKDTNPQAYEKLKKAYNALSYQQETLVATAINLAETVKKLNEITKMVDKLSTMLISIKQTEFRKPF